MTQLVLNIESPAMVRTIRNLVKNLSGVHIEPSSKKKISGYDMAMADVKAGRVKKFSNVDDLMQDLLDVKVKILIDNNITSKISDTIRSFGSRIGRCGSFLFLFGRERILR